MRLLVAYGSKMGGTKGLAEMLGTELTSLGYEVDICRGRDDRHLHTLVPPARRRLRTSFNSSNRSLDSSRRGGSLFRARSCREASEKSASAFS